MLNRIIWVLIIPMTLILRGDSLAWHSETKISISMQARFESWKIDRKSYHHLNFDGNKTWGYSPMLEETDGGSLFGPELQFSKGRFYACAFYFGGKGTMDTLGNAEISYLGADLGILGARGKIGGFLGYRQFSLGLSNNVLDIEDQSIMDFMLGVILRSDPEREGFFLDFKAAFGLRIFASAFSSNEKDSDAPPDTDSLAEFEMNLGYRPRGQPFGLQIGYGFWGWQDRIEECTTSSPLYDECVEGAIGRNYGPVLRVVYLIRG